MPERADRLILVDPCDRVLGTADKVTIHRDALLHRAFSVFLTDGNGRLLLQKRASGKYHSGGLWANACCSHPRAGEELLPSAEARLTEELGMTCPLREIGSFLYFRAFSPQLYEYEYDHVLLGHYAGSFAPDAGEIEALRWVTAEELGQELLQKPQQFAAWFPTAASMVLRELSAGEKA